MRTRLLVASLVSISFAGVAAAQDAPAGDAPAGDGTTETTPPTDPATGSPMPAPDAAGDATSHDGGLWPRAIINRPLTLPKGLLQVGADVLTSTSSFFDPAGIRALVGYGITDDFELDFAAYSFSSDDAGKGRLAADLGYKLVRGAAGGKLEVIARANIGYDLAEDAAGDALGVTPLGLGAHVQYNVTPKIAIISGLPGAEQLTIGLKDVHPIVLALPVGVGFQATPELFIEADTVLADLVLSDDDTGAESTYIFSDSTPLQLTASYNAMPALDVYATLGLDVTPPDGTDLGDTVFVGVGARYYVGDAVKATAAAPPPAM